MANYIVLPDFLKSIFILVDMLCPTNVNEKFKFWTKFFFSWDTKDGIPYSMACKGRINTVPFYVGTWKKCQVSRGQVRCWQNHLSYWSCIKRIETDTKKKCYVILVIQYTGKKPSRQTLLFKLIYFTYSTNEIYLLGYGAPIPTPL